MTDVLFEISIIVLLTFVNGFFALAEIAVVSARKPRLQKLSDEGSIGARVALELADDPDRFLTTVQIGITLIGVFAGAFGGATLSGRMATAIGPWIGTYALPISLMVVVGTITIASIIFGELLPKRIALVDPERFACALSRPIAVIARLLTPVGSVLSRVTEVFVSRIKTSDSTTVSEEEIAIMVERGTEEGVLHEVEEEMVKKVLRLDKWTVNSLMTPRTDIVWVDIQASPQESWQQMVASERSHFPVCDGSVDKLLGVISLKELLKTVLAGEEIQFREFIERPLMIPSGTSVLKLIEQLKSNGTHFAIIVDEHGSLDGIVTLHDILEALVGVVSSEDESTFEPEIVRRTDGSWLMDAGVHIDQVKDQLDLRELPSEELGYQTLRGFIMAHLGAIPKEGERFTWEGYHFEVVDMDGHKIDKVLVEPVSPKPHPESESGT